MTTHDNTHTQTHDNHISRGHLPTATTRASRTTPTTRTMTTPNTMTAGGSAATIITRGQISTPTRAKKRNESNNANNLSKDNKDKSHSENATSTLTTKNKTTSRDQGNNRR